MCIKCSRRSMNASIVCLFLSCIHFMFSSTYSEHTYKWLKMRDKEPESEHDFQKAHINVQLPAEENRLLTLAAKRSGRTKRQELLIRLSDHLKNFEDIAAEGLC